MLHSRNWDQSIHAILKLLLEPLLRRTVYGPVLVGLCALALYLPRVDNAPADLYRDEAFHAMSAHSLATTGRDLNGRLLPLIVAPNAETSMVEAGAPPLLVYAMAAIYRVLPVSETSTRLPMILIGVIDVLLVYAIGRVLFDRVLLAELAAALLALTPAHFMFSRLALTAQVPVPFVLGWLLCVLLYLRRGDARLLFLASALLMLAAAAYFAILVLVPFYALLTASVMYRRRSPLGHYVTLVAGIVLPIVVGVPWLLWDTQELQRILTHYDWRDPRRGGAVDAASVYWTFWGPRFLFVDGAPRIEFSTRLAGVFVLSISSAMLIGFVQALRRLSPHTVLLLGGLLSAPVPASLVGEGQAIWRALPIVPFGVLTAVLGVRHLWTTDSDRGQRISFVAGLGSLVALSAIYHGYQPYAQALLRAALAPLVVVGLAALLRSFDVQPRQLIGVASAALAALFGVQIVLFTVDYSVVIAAAPWLAAALAGAVFMPGASLTGSRLGAAAAVGLLAIVASEFAYFHIERITLAGLPLVPTGAVLPLTRFAAAAAAVAAALAWATRWRATERQRPADATFAAVPGLIAIQVAYYHVDYFSGERARAVHVAAVLLATVWLVMRLRTHIDRHRVAALATGAVMTLASLQFAYFYGDYLTSYQERAFSPDGSVRVALERVIARIGDRPAPAVYFWNFGHHGLDDWYWHFYLVKHRREDVASRTIRGEEPVSAALERIRDLPAGSLIVTRPFNQIDSAIDQMRRAGYVSPPDIIRQRDGRPVFWILERLAS